MVTPVAGVRVEGRADEDGSWRGKRERPCWERGRDRLLALRAADPRPGHGPGLVPEEEKEAAQSQRCQRQG